MPPRFLVCSKCGLNNGRIRPACADMVRYVSRQAITPAPQAQQFKSSHPIKYSLNTQPPSHKPPEFRQTQLHRQYTSLIKSTSMMVLFQHNNLTASEWTGIRRELSIALGRVDDAALNGEEREPLGGHIKLQVIKTGIFGAALRVAEYYNRELLAAGTVIAPGDPSIESSTPTTRLSKNLSEPDHTHSVSRAAHSAVLSKRYSHPLVPLLNGPIAILTFPTVSTEHLKAALTVLSPSRPHFQAPSRRMSPGLYEPQVQSAISKLMLLGARVEGGVFDLEGTKWVGTINGGIGGLRSQLVATLQGAGVALVSGLENASKSLFFTMESRRSILEEESATTKEGKA